MNVSSTDRKKILDTIAVARREALTLAGVFMRLEAAVRANKDDARIHDEVVSMDILASDIQVYDVKPLADLIKRLLKIPVAPMPKNSTPGPRIIGPHRIMNTRGF